jgi:putative peptidoglycan lipid II flippase
MSIDLKHAKFTGSIFLSNRVIWLSFFSYSLAVALLFQMVLPLLLPALHFGEGLLFPDSAHFHQSAIDLAGEIRLNGWGAWKIWPSNTTTGNVAIMGAIYAIFGHKPLLILPLNAALHASGGLCLILIGRELFSGNFARVGSVIAGCLFIVFPSSLNWYAQNHKDGYAALGFLLLVLAGVRLLKANKLNEVPTSIILVASGLFLTILVRPHNLQLFAALGVGILFFGIFCALKNKIKFIPLVIYASLIILSSAIIKVLPIQAVSTPQNIAGSFANDWAWNASPELPNVVDKTVQKLANIRVFMAATALRDGAGSVIDIDSMPADFYSSVRYFSVTGLNGIFAPFPNSWLTKMSHSWLVGVGEIMIWYLLFPGMLWLMWRERGNLAMWWVVLSTYIVLSAESFLVPNLGTLHRIRYPFLFIFILLGCIGWCTLIKFYVTKNTIEEKFQDTTVNFSPVSNVESPSYKNIYKAIPLIVMNALLFFALFFRDVFFAHQFGLGSVLDDFQYAANLPLTVAALLAVPLGPVLITQFEKLHDSNLISAKKWVSRVSGNLLVWFLSIGLLLLLVQVMGLSGSELKKSTFLGIWFLPVVALSGLTVLGNAVLICNKKSTLATSLQLVVPLLAIFLTYFFSESIGVMVPIAGLVVGQIINLVLVAYFCRRCGFSLSPRLASVDFGAWAPAYLSLVASAAITGLSIPIALFFSSKMIEGSTAIFYMGGKVFQSLSVFICAIFLALLLPYFIKLVKLNHIQYSREVLSKVFNLGVFLAAFASLLLCSIAPEIAQLIFSTKSIEDNQLETITLVIQVGIFQLPFFIASLILIKYFVASNEAAIIFFATIVGQTVNALLSLLVLHQDMAVEMLAVSTVIGLALTSGVLIFWAILKKMLYWQTLYFLVLLLPAFIAVISSILISQYLALFLSFSIFIIIPFVVQIFPLRSSIVLKTT